MHTPARPFDRIARRTLREAGLHGDRLETFKHDHRSVVWRVDSVSGPRVVKQFVFSPLRQRLSMLIGVHPAQIELRWNLALQSANVPVVPLVDGGVETAGVGCKVWLATPLTGQSMQRLIRHAEVRQSRGEELMRSTAELARKLFTAGFWSRDLKPSNIVIDAVGRAQLIDVGSVRRGISAVTRERTLAVMDRVLARDGVEPALRRRFAELVAHGA